MAMCATIWPRWSCSSSRAVLDDGRRAATYPPPAARDRQSSPDAWTDCDAGCVLLLSRATTVGFMALSSSSVAVVVVHGLTLVGQVGASRRWASSGRPRARWARSSARSGGGTALDQRCQQIRSRAHGQSHACTRRSASCHTTRPLAVRLAVRLAVVPSLFSSLVC
jgi:hypothetical protein